MWLDKKLFKRLIVQYQELNDDTDDEWLKIRNIKKRGDEEAYQKFVKNRAEFIVIKKDWYARKRLRLSRETSEETENRRKELEKVKEDLFANVYALIDNVGDAFGLRSLKGDESYEDIKQNIVLKLMSILNRFDCRRENPIAYYIQVIKRMFYAERGVVYAQRKRFPNMTFLETNNGDEDGPTISDKT